MAVPDDCSIDEVRQLAQPNCRHVFGPVQAGRRYPWNFDGMRRDERGGDGRFWRESQSGQTAGIESPPHLSHARFRVICRALPAQVSWFCSTSVLIERVAGPVHEFWRNGPTSAVKQAIRLKRYLEQRRERSLRMAGG